MIATQLLEEDMFARSTHRNRPGITSALATACSILLLTFSPQFAAHAAPPAVTNCNNSGTGSLRAAIAGAASGDTIDMSSLACTVNLQSTLAVNQTSLTIEGRQEKSVDEGPVTRISGGNQYRVFNHAGTGTLRLRWLTVTNGNVTASSAAHGGCIRSTGNVHLFETWIRACKVLSQDAARGGGVYAQGSVTLNGNTRVANNTAESLYSPASGGGIYAGGNLIAPVGSNAHVENNDAWTGYDGGDVRGGGIYANFLWAAGLTVANNRVSSLNTQGVNRGGGIYARDGMLGQAHIAANNARDENRSSYGGGLYVLETLTLIDSTVINNKAMSGAGIYSNTNGSLSVSNSSIDGNHASYRGGGIFAGDLVLEKSSVDGNHASDRGGGIFVGELVLENSSVSGNHAESSAGGLKAEKKATIRRSTIAANTALMAPGAIFGTEPSPPGTTVVFLMEQSTVSGNIVNLTSAGTVAGLDLNDHTIIRNSTITENQGSNNIGSGGVGIWVHRDVELELYSTVVSNNTRPVDGPDPLPYVDIISSLGALVVTGSNNLIGKVHSGSALPPDTIRKDDPGLGALGNHGGSTLTHVPRLGSPLINKGLDNGFTTDQRGVARVWGAAADIGSVEWHPADDIIFRDGFEGD